MDILLKGVYSPSTCLPGILDLYFGFQTFGAGARDKISHRIRICGQNCLTPLIGLRNKQNEILKSIYWGFPTGFEYFGPQIRIPGEHMCI